MQKNERTRLSRRITSAVSDWAVVLFDPLEQRLDPEAMRKSWATFSSLGEVLFILFMIQTLTGILLSLYYHPSPEMAYESVRYLLTDVHFGNVIHSLHHWSAQAMVLAAFIHVTRGFFIGSFKHPNELGWMIAVLQMLLIVAFSFTGHLLPWDEGAYWTSVVGTDLLGQIPLIGEPLMHIARGGEDVGGPTLSRFYSLHILIFPWLFFYLALFLLLLRRKEKLLG